MWIVRLALRRAYTFVVAALLILVVSLVAHYSGDSPDLEAIRMIAVAFQLGFFVWVFTTKEVRRKEFSPQMEQFLVTLAGRAKHARTALVRMQVK